MENRHAVLWTLTLSVDTRHAYANVVDNTKTATLKESTLERLDKNDARTRTTTFGDFRKTLFVYDMTHIVRDDWYVATPLRGRVYKIFFTSHDIYFGILFF